MISWDCLRSAMYESIAICDGYGEHDIWSVIHILLNYWLILIMVSYGTLFWKTYMTDNVPKIMRKGRVLMYKNIFHS